MPDYRQLLRLCQEDSRLSKLVIDEFLLYYAAQRDKVDREFDRGISKFKHVLSEMPSNWLGLAKSQYIAYRLFKEGGLIRKYMQHVSLREMVPEEKQYLGRIIQYPWRFSFSEILANPAPDFYEMTDIYTGETYLLYSPTVTMTLKESPVSLWFNLVAFNGSCWQTFGPIVYFKCFTADDIFFYGSEINPAVASDAELLNDLEENPIRYMFLVCGSNFPRVIMRGHEVVQVAGEGHLEAFDLQFLRKELKIEYAHAIYKLTHPDWTEPPHYAEAYYNENTGNVFLSAMTEKGYEEMAIILNNFGMHIPPGPEVQLHLPMITVIEKLYKKRLELNPYSSLFETKVSKNSEAALAKINHFMSLLLPYVNSGKQPDLEALAKQAGIDAETARSVYKATVDQIRDMRNRL